MTGDAPDPRASGGVDVLDGGRDRSARLGLGWNRLTCRARAFVRRHPRRVATAGCLVVVAAGLAVYTVTRGTPVEEVVRVRADGAGSVHFLGTAPRGDDEWLYLVDPDEKLQGSYRVGNNLVGDVVGVIGLVGPGLRAPTADTITVTAGSDASLSAGATLDCSDASWAAATDRDYRMRMRRTDAHADVTAYDAPLAHGATDLRALVRLACLRRAVAGLPADSWTVEATPGTAQARVSLRVRNPNAFPLRLQVSSWWGPTASATTSTIALAAGGTSALTMKPLIIDCTSPSAFPFFYVDGRGSTYLALRVGVDGSSQASTGAQDLAGLPIERQEAVAVNRGLARACQGAPITATRVTGVHRVRAAKPAPRWRIDVRIRVAADRAEFGAARITPGLRDYPMLDELFDDPHLTVPGPATAHGGVARARLTWTLPGCLRESDSMPGPPSTTITVVVAGHRYSAQVSLSDRALLTAVLAACPGIGSDDEAAASGWQTRT